MRKSLNIFILFLLPLFGNAQQQYVDSLKNILKTAKIDSTRYSALNGIGEYYVEINQDSAIFYLDKAFHIAKNNNKPLNEAVTIARKGYVLIHKEKYPESLMCLKEALDLSSGTGFDAMWNLNSSWLFLSTPDKNRLTVLAGVHLQYAFLMSATGDHDQYDIQLKLSRTYAATAGDLGLVGVVNMNLGVDYGEKNRIDSALILEKDAERIANQTGDNYLPFIDFVLGGLYIKKGNNKLALQYYHRSLTISLQQNASLLLNNAYSALSAYYIARREKDSCLYYSVKRLQLVRQFNLPQFDLAYDDVFRSYQLANNMDSAYKYQGLALAATKSRDQVTIKNLTDFQKLSMKQQLSLERLERENEDAQTRARMFALLMIIAVVLIVAMFIYRNSRQRKKANYLLQHQKEEIAAQRDNLSHTLDELKATQTQLVQREKMASLGELTAGIAHEIQNPLNFVNNFSEVNKEMVEELEYELKKGNVNEALALAADIRANEEKITHHGKRADFIVKGMLQHSRTSTGEKQPTDINILADEFLKLSYHGLRAKDKSFNAVSIAIGMITDFDETLPKVNIARQDIGRVLLNMFNNAFYAVNQKQKTAGTDYKPEVSVSTSIEKNHLIIKVKDNGNGIPDAIRDKIMQPFFTTKPTGEGTGLGLSLSYDIVVKGHGGTITINTKEGEFTEFTVKLPIS